MKRSLSSILFGLTVTGLLGFKILEVWFQQTASSTPDASTGRTQAYVFARSISPDSDYITSLQGWLIMAPGIVAIACFIAALVAIWRERGRRGALAGRPSTTLAARLAALSK